MDNTTTAGAVEGLGGIWIERDILPRTVGDAAASISLAAMGLTTMVFGHEERVRQARAVITHTHSDKPLSKRARRRARGKATP